MITGYLENGRPHVSAQPARPIGPPRQYGCFRVVVWWHPLGATRFEPVWYFHKPLSLKPGALSHPCRTPPHSSFRWIGAQNIAGISSCCQDFQIVVPEEHRMTVRMVAERCKRRLTLRDAMNNTG